MTFSFQLTQLKSNDRNKVLTVGILHQYLWIIIFIVETILKTSGAVQRLWVLQIFAHFILISFGVATHFLSYVMSIIAYRKTQIRDTEILNVPPPTPEVFELKERIGVILVSGLLPYTSLSLIIGNLYSSMWEFYDEKSVSMICTYLFFYLLQIGCVSI